MLLLELVRHLEQRLRDLDVVLDVRVGPGLRPFSDLGRLQQVLDDGGQPDPIELAVLAKREGYGLFSSPGRTVRAWLTRVDENRAGCEISVGTEKEDGNEDPDG